MQQTTNYKLNKIELSDSPADITVLNSNWDTIDTNLKKLSDEKFNKAGGTVSGTVTITGKLTENDGIDLTGGNLTISNGSVSVNGLLTVGGLDISKQVDNSEIRVNGGNGLEHGGSLVVYGKDSTINKGGFLLQAHNGTNGATLTGSPDGTLTWSGKLIASGGAELNGNVTFNNAMIGKTSFLSVVDVTKGTAPSAQKSFHWGFYDKNGFGIPANRLARIQYTIGTDNNPQMAMFVNRPNEGSTEDPVGIIAQWIGNTSARISVTHHPSTDSNDKQIATTYWVRNLRATTSQYGLIKVADETALLTESNDAALTVDKAYELNDFRRMNTAYVVGDKVNCAFNFGVYLECTTAGTTSAESLDTRNVTFGQVITDGTAQWTVRAHIKSINGAVPDGNGNVDINIEGYALEQDILDACDEALENGTGGASGETDLETLLNQYAQMVVNYQNILANMADYVIEKGENDKGWYRIYKSGWVEQGGSVITTEQAKVIELPIEMQDTNYKVQITVFDDADYGGISGSDCLQTNGSTTTQITVSHLTITTGFTWEVKGYRKTTTESVQS